MSKFSLFGLLVVLCSLPLLGFNQNQQIDRKQLRAMLTQLGYEVEDIVKDAGKEKYSVKFARNDLNIPVGFEISPSLGYIWLTVNLGDAPTETSPKNYALLKQNAKVQPCQFYLTDSGRMMMGLPIENRAVTNQVLRARAESIAENVGKTKDVWQK